MEWLVDKVIADGWFEAHVLPQLHVLIWGNRDAASKAVPARAHPEKCETVFGKDACQNKGLERRSDSIRSKRALKQNRRARSTIGARHPENIACAIIIDGTARNEEKIGQAIDILQRLR